MHWYGQPRVAMMGTVAVIATGEDERMDAVVSMGQELLKSGMNAGSSYSEVWIRDLNTFIVPLLDVAPRQSVRDALLVFFHFHILLEVPL